MGDEGEMGTLRERKKAETEAALEAAALELFERKGFAATTVDEIVAAAQVSRRTFFRYFDSKEAVILAHEHEDLARFRHMVTGRPSSESRAEAMAAAIVDMAAFIETTRERSLAVAKIVAGTRALEARVADLQVRWTRAMADDLASREGRREPDLKDKLVAALYLSVVRFAIEEWQLSGCDPSLVDLTRKNLEALNDEILAPTRVDA